MESFRLKSELFDFDYNAFHDALAVASFNRQEVFKAVTDSITRVEQEIEKKIFKKENLPPDEIMNLSNDYGLAIAGCIDRWRKDYTEISKKWGLSSSKLRALEIIQWWSEPVFMTLSLLPEEQIYLEDLIRSCATLKRLWSLHDSLVRVEVDRNAKLTKAAIWKSRQDINIQAVLQIAIDNHDIKDSGIYYEQGELGVSSYCYFVSRLDISRKISLDLFRVRNGKRINTRTFDKNVRYSSESKNKEERDRIDFYFANLIDNNDEYMKLFSGK